jgi:hypothetical protein
MNGATDLEIQGHIARLTELEKRVLHRVLHRDRVARDVAAEFDESLSLGARLADRIASFGGSWPGRSIPIPSSSSTWRCPASPRSRRPSS